MTCEEFEQLSGAYALDAITPDERRVAEAHLATCAKCSRLVQELRGVVALLPLTVNQISPPSSLEARILKAIQQAETPPPLRMRPARRRRWQPAMLVAAAVLMFSLLGGMTAWNFTLHNQVAQLQEQVAHGSSAPVSYQVKGTDIAAGATGQLLYYPAQNITVLTVSGLPQLRGAHVYQGWLLQTRDGTITAVKSIGLLNTGDGSASLSYQGNLTGYNGAAISLEPGPTPTPNAPKGSVVARSSLAQS
jgi:anti-sigma-K factor RskA